MLVSRRDEEDKTWFRSDRVFHSNAEWFFHTREGIDVGPYESQFEAEIEAGLLKELLKTLREDDAPVATIREFILDSFSWGRPLSATFNDETDHTVSPPGRPQRTSPKRTGPKQTGSQQVATKTQGTVQSNSGNVVSLKARRK